MAGLSSAVLQAFQEGYNLPATMRARDAAREEFGPAADAPGLFTALRADRRAEANQDLNRRVQEQTIGIRGAQERRTQQGFETEQSLTEEERKRRAVLGLVNGLRSARDQGQDVGEAFDQQMETMSVLGVSEEDIPAMRQAVVDNPAVLDDYYQALTGGQTKPSSAKEQRAAADAAKAADSEIAKFDDVLNRIDKLQDPERKAAARSVIGFPTPGKAMKGGFGAAGSVIGTPAADYVSDFEALTEGDIRAIAFETLKGGGQITEKESEFARDAIASLKRTTSFEKYEEELADLRTYIERLRDAAIRRNRGENVPDITENTGAAAAQPQEIYIGFKDPETGAVFQGVGEDGQQIWEFPE